MDLPPHRHPRTAPLREGEDVATLAVAACADALADAGRAAEDVDAIIISTITPDYLTPGLAPLVAYRLGALRASAVDINAGVRRLPPRARPGRRRSSSPGARNLVLVCGAEGAEPHHRPHGPLDRRAARRRRRRGRGHGAVTTTSGCRPSSSAPTAHRRALLYVDQDKRVLHMRGAGGLPARGRPHGRGDRDGARGPRRSRSRTSTSSFRTRQTLVSSRPPLTGSASPGTGSPSTCRRSPTPPARPSRSRSIRPSGRAPCTGRHHRARRLRRGLRVGRRCGDVEGGAAHHHRSTHEETRTCPS